MKKIFTSLAVVVLAGINHAQVITQNSTPNTVSPTGSVACGNSAEGYTSQNSYYRVFKLSDFGINYAYNVTNIAFGVQTASDTFPVTVDLYNLTGTFPAGTQTLLGTANVTVAPANVGLMVNTGTSLSQVVPAGGTFVVKISHDGSADGVSFYMGSHPGAQTGLSYLSSGDCSITTPIATGTGPLANFALARWVMTVTGQNNLGVTEVINSKDLQVYPNPVHDILKFKFGSSLKSENIDIYDMTGRVVTSVANSKNVNEVNVSSYPKGTYILKVKASDGKVYIQKIIKE
ncbi:hypothetical protein CEY12_04925 [Chryseobacterium sp. T16E-39]|uniref:T9SS type A sorting domain-containing protein n=1 Tax=Chryseobacterium sp. T16E-39 TaxID=2015076 RepID=UPI000B5B1345|nr:T9SS type A sorting domain-containing protein [Chryseobacterium sp. T16E-39]ASK29486.1 hypothetical protein CEY12_04925 [Chryseobacterium sp. T16E-39]